MLMVMDFQRKIFSGVLLLPYTNISKTHGYVIVKLMISNYCKDSITVTCTCIESIQSTFDYLDVLYNKIGGKQDRYLVLVITKLARCM